MKKLFLPFIALLLWSCGGQQSKENKANIPASTLPIPAQYGTPYADVPESRDVIIYQVNIRAFSPQGNFAGVIARLDSIHALDVNVLYLMPTYPVGQLKAKDSPYCVKNYYGVNTDFGTLDDLRMLVKDAHRDHMAVIMDWIANHTSWDNDWIKNKDWYEQDSAGNIIYPPEGWQDVAQLNFKNTDMRQAMIRAMKYWIYAVNIDGYRCDFVDGPPEDFWKQAIDTLRAIPGHKLLMLAEGQRSENYQAGFDYNFGFKFYGKLKEIFNDRLSAKAIDSLNMIEYEGASDGQEIVRYITNHDVNSSDGSPDSLFGGEHGAMAAFIVAAYMKSLPMNYTGQEVGTPFRIRFPFTMDKINWSLNPGVTAEYKKVLAFRNNSAAIRRGNLMSYTTDDVCAFTKTLGSEEVFVMSNLRNKKVLFKLPSDLKIIAWKDAFTGNLLKPGNQVLLKPFEYRVFKK